MRLVGPDIALFVVGALLFGGSAYGLVQTGGLSGGGSAFNAYTLTWSASEEEVVVAEFETTPSVDFNFTVRGAGITVVAVTVDCSHAPSVPPQVSTSIEVDVSGPGNLTGSGTGQCGEAVTVEVPVAPMPEGGAMEAGSAEEAEEKAVTGVVGSEAAGEWTGEVRFTSGDGAAVAGVQIEYSGDVTAGITRAEATATPVTTR